MNILEYSIFACIILIVSGLNLRSLDTEVNDFETLEVANFAALTEALPIGIEITSLIPVFDFDSDGCLPAAGISRTGEPNGGLNPSGSITGGCRLNDFLTTSNTYHRNSCVNDSGNTYCAFVFALYFAKDQTIAGGVFGTVVGGHRHDWEKVVIWTINGAITHGSYSAHGDLFTETVDKIPKQNGKLKFVYHKDGISTHAMRFAGNNENAENEYSTFVTPPVVDWFTMIGDETTNAELRKVLETYDYGSAVFPNKDNRFFKELNEDKPNGYPLFAHDM